MLMNPDTDNILLQLQQLRRLFAEAAPTDAKTISEYAWIIAKSLHHNHEQLGSYLCRQLLADYLKLPTERPSRLHSAILSAAIKVANTYPDFHFAAFLKIWSINNLRHEDEERPKTTEGKRFPSLAERTARALAHSLLIHEEDIDSFKAEASEKNDLLAAHGYSISPMLVTRIKEVLGKDGRKYCFATLTSPTGIEVESIVNSLLPSPLHPLPDGKRHYVNIGQLYNVLLQSNLEYSLTNHADVIPNRSTQVLKTAYLSQRKVQEIFPTEIGYIESIDTTHAHMHVYDRHSRHFVAHRLHFSREQVGDFVQFIPIVPQASKFKTAIILATVSSASDAVQSGFRTIRILKIDQEKKYATWQVFDKEGPVIEKLSPLQVAQGLKAPYAFSGFIDISSNAAHPSFSEGDLYRAFVFLKRGKNGKKYARATNLIATN